MINCACPLQALKVKLDLKVLQAQLVQLVQQQLLLLERFPRGQQAQVQR